MLRALLIVASLVIPIWLTILSAMWIPTISAMNLAFFLPFLYIWVFGVLGQIGLIRSLCEFPERTPDGIRTSMVLLGAGVVSGSLLLAALISIFGTHAQGNSIGFLVFAAFPLFPIIVAIFEIRRLRKRLRAFGTAPSSRARRLRVAILVLPVLLAPIKLVVEEVAVIWYGHDLVGAATVAAEEIAQGLPYCIQSGKQFVADFSDLDKRAIIKHAVRQYGRNIKRRPANWRQPHFRIIVDDKAYWWSFKRRRFLYLQNHAWSQVPPGGCPVSERK